MQLFILVLMALLLCIDTALETALVGLCRDEKIFSSETNTDQKNHAAFVQPAIQKIMNDSRVSFLDIDAVAVVNGPGSYTGLRVGLASAKGICYASGKPLILLNTLAVMATSAIQHYNDAHALYCPVIDARRNEVFAAVYDFFMKPVLPPRPLIIEESSFEKLLQKQKMIFFGSGHNKCGNIVIHENATFSDNFYTLYHINKLAQQNYLLKEFGDVAYAEPFYTKEFYMVGR